MRRLPRLRTGPLVLASAATLPAYLLLNSDSLPSPATPHELPLRALLRSYIVYTLCSIPPLVDHSPRLLDAVTSVPGLRHLAYGLVKVTFFDQVCSVQTLFPFRSGKRQLKCNLTSSSEGKQPMLRCHYSGHYARPTRVLYSPIQWRSTRAKPLGPETRGDRRRAVPSPPAPLLTNASSKRSSGALTSPQTLRTL